MDGKYLVATAHVLVVPVVAQTNIWQVRNVPLQPDIQLAAMSYDAARQEVVLAGRGSVGFETWVWDGSMWAVRNPSTSPTSIVWVGQMAYDAVRQESLYVSGPFFGWPATMWAWDGLTWAQRSVVGMPNGNHGGMAFDAWRARLVLLCAQVSGSPPGGPTTVLVGEWNGNSWASVVPAAGSSAYSGYAAYDPLIHKVVFAGAGGTASWDGAAFGGLSTASSSGRIAFHASNGALTRFDSGDYTSEFLSGNWVQSPIAWTCCLQGSFVARAVVYDAARNQLVVYGRDDAGPITATSGPFTSQAITTVAGASCGVPGLQLVADPSARPLLGTTARCRLTGAPTPLFVMAMGFNTQFYGPFPVPLPLDGVGMTGCVLRHSADILGLSLTPVGADLEYALSVPFTSTLLGFPCHMQGYGFAPGANPAQIAMTNMLTWIVGNQ